MFHVVQVDTTQWAVGVCTCLAWNTYITLENQQKENPVQTADAESDLQKLVILMESIIRKKKREIENCS